MGFGKSCTRTEPFLECADGSSSAQTGVATANISTAANSSFIGVSMICVESLLEFIIKDRRRECRSAKFLRARSRLEECRRARFLPEGCRPARYRRGLSPLEQCHQGACPQEAFLPAKCRRAASR